MAGGVSRFSVSVDPELLEEFDQVVLDHGYNRSTAVQVAMRDFLSEHKWKDEEGTIVGAVTLFYDHHTSGLMGELNDLQHVYHDVILSATHLHMDHDNCLEILAVKGEATRIKDLSKALSIIRGIKQIKLSLI
jgi:CopG family nickel-responsive transcriptional regulator